jgi:GNAT superfamily N-acetyltransferase
MVGDEYIGLAVSERNRLGAWNSVLAVEPGYRRKGIGTAMQARALVALKAQGFEFLNVAGVKSDIGYVAVQRRLGANIEPDWISYEQNIK